MLNRLAGALCAALLVQRSAALHLPSAHLLATTARDACAALGVPKDEWLEPEDAASAVARALSAISLPAAEAEGNAPPVLPALPPQGEFVFSTDVHADRYAEAEEAAFAGDARAQHTLGLLLWGGVGDLALGLGLGLGLRLDLPSNANPYPDQAWAAARRTRGSRRTGTPQPPRRAT